VTVFDDFGGHLVATTDQGSCHGTFRFRFSR
jgi:hypothetical protein